MAYAEGTQIPVEQTKVEIARLLKAHGASRVLYRTSDYAVMVCFELNGHAMRYRCAMPGADQEVFTHTAGRRFQRLAADAARLYEQACRARWRALWFVLRAKFEAVEAGIASVEEEFAGALQLEDGRTVTEHALPHLRLAPPRAAVAR